MFREVKNNLNLTKLLLINCLLAISGTIGMSLIPLLCIEKLQLSSVIYGLLEGGSEFLSAIVRLCGGTLFDLSSVKTSYFVYPIILAFLSKLVLLFPTGVGVLVAKIVERLSNGLFGNLRDAYALFESQNTNSGSVLSWLAVSKSVGCLIGPLLCSVYFYYNPQGGFPILIFACLSCCFLALCLCLSLEKKEERVIAKASGMSGVFDKKELFKLIPFFCLVMVFFLARFNDGVLILYLKYLGFSPSFYYGTIGIFNFFMILSSPGFGFLLNKSRVHLALFLTVGSLFFFNVLFFVLNILEGSASLIIAILGLFFWGVQRNGAQMVFLSIAKRTCPKYLLGRVVGVSSVVGSLGSLIASVIAGFLSPINFSLVFLYSGFISLLCLIFILFIIKSRLII